MPPEQVAPSPPAPASGLRPKDLPESRMYAPVADWLTAQGYRVFAELWGHDVVAVRGDHIVAVELKMSFTRRLLSQVTAAGTFADAAYAAVPKMPRRGSFDRCCKCGLGLLVVNGTVRVIREPERHCWEPERQKVLEAIRDWRPPAEQVGGIPTLAGQGDAQRVQRLVDAYRQGHPSASWRDVYRDVPNHYAHHASMRQAMRSVSIRDARAKRAPARAAGGKGKA